MILEIILGITTITFGYTSFNLFRKVERLEDWVEDYSQRIVDADTTLKQIDSEGKFESDDEIGVIFDGIKNTIKEADINELNRIISNGHDKYGGLYEKSKLPEGMDYLKFKKMLINLSERFDFKNTNLKKPRKFDSLTDVNKQKIYDMSLDKSVDQDQLQDIVDELRDEEKFFGAR